MSFPRAALFDMDGLLLATEQVYHDTFLLETRAAGVPDEVASPMLISLVGTSGAHSDAIIAKALPGLDIEAIRARFRVNFLARMAQDVPLRPTAERAIAALRATGLPMAVVTSTNTEQAREQLARAGLLPAFLTVIGGDVVPAHKPDPSPYLMGAEAIGIAPSDCVAFEDSDPGVQSATAAGCTVWQIPDLRPAGKAFPELGQNRAETLYDAVMGAGLL